MKILVFPKDPNPYQSLLYKSLGELDDNIRIRYLTIPKKLEILNLFILPILLVAYRIRGYSIFHIHWFYTFRLPRFDNEISKIIMEYYLISFIYLTKILGYKIIWTVHETISHTAITDNDICRSRSISRKLSRIASAKIIHSNSVIKEMLDNGLDIDNCKLIPHGSYMGVYPDLITPDEAREKLKVGPNEFVILFFGNIREYKGVDTLLEAFSKVKKSNARLIIAGRCKSESMIVMIHRYMKTNNIDFYNNHISDEEVATFFKASNIVCLPFKEITTSGSVILSFTFGKPIIAPRLGALNDVPTNIGFLYDHPSTSDLLACINKAISCKRLSSMSISASEYAESLSWDKIAYRTLRVYENSANL
jgi:beta-1,4-mannosyltransferase